MKSSCRHWSACTQSCRSGTSTRKTCPRCRLRRPPRCRHAPASTEARRGPGGSGHSAAAIASAIRTTSAITSSARNRLTNRWRRSSRSPRALTCLSGSERQQRSSSGLPPYRSGVDLLAGQWVRSRRIPTLCAPLLIFALLAAGCAPPASAPSGSTSSAPASAPSAPKRITVAMLGELPSFWDDINPGGGTIPGMGQFEGLASAGLQTLDEHEALQPQLGEAVPTTENGMWQVFPDGRMEVTFRIRQGAKWHDGQPFTSADLLFTAEMGRDPDVRVLSDPAYELIDAIEATDDRTVVVRWKQPYI